MKWLEANNIFDIQTGLGPLYLDGLTFIPMHPSYVWDRITSSFQNVNDCVVEVINDFFML